MIVDFESYRIDGTRLRCTRCQLEPELVSATGKTVAELMAVAVRHHGSHHGSTPEPVPPAPAIDPLLRR